MNDAYILLQKVLEKKKYKEISEFLFVSEGTVKRWIKKEKVPSQYKIDLMRLLGENVDYKKFTSQEKDQFFTSEKTAKYCYDIFKKVMKNKNVDINEYIFIEPSAGDGAFLNVLPKETISLDIEPRHEKIKKQNFLVWEPENKAVKYIGFGNPPFGLRGNLAVRFINHFSKFADLVCFILPQLFESDGKGSPRKRIKEYNLIYSGKLEDSNFYYPEKKEEFVKVNCIFQIWSKEFTEEKYKIKKIKNSDIKIVSLSNGIEKCNKRNVKDIGKCDLYIPSTCFGIEKIKCYKSFDELPNKRGFGIKIDKKYKYTKELIQKINEYDWTIQSYLSTNSAYNLRTSKIMGVVNNFYKEINSKQDRLTELEKKHKELSKKMEELSKKMEEFRIKIDSNNIYNSK